MSLFQNLLLGSIVVPFLCSILLLSGLGKGRVTLRNISYLGFIFPFLSGIILFLNFDNSVDGYCFEVFYPQMGLHELKSTFHLGLNGVSSPLFAMAGIVGLAAGLTAINSGADRLRLYLSLLLMMQSGLMGLFASIDLFFYYLFHEFALIPTFIMIGIWGGRDRRSIALEITIYLTLGALISLGGLVALNVLVDAEKFDFPSLSNAIIESSLGDSTQNKIFGLLLFGFGILVALFPFHTWAAKGYEAAPTSVSMLHAGVLKKFGLYGLIQIAVPLLPDGASTWSSYLMWLALGNVLLVGFVTMAQTNLKSMIGYGSVMHMGYCFLGIATCSALGAGAGVMLMVAHGLSVSGMFLLAKFVHQRSGTFEMNQMGGLGIKTPLLACFFIAMTLATIGLPGFGNFWGEFGIFLSLGQDRGNLIFLVLAASGIIISAIFGLRAVAKIFYGTASGDLQEHEKQNPIFDLKYSEILPASIILVPLLFLGLWPKGTSQRIDNEIKIRYSVLDSSGIGSLPPCCLVNKTESYSDSNQSVTDSPENINSTK